MSCIGWILRVVSGDGSAPYMLSRSFDFLELPEPSIIDKLRGTSKKKGAQLTQSPKTAILQNVLPERGHGFPG